MTLSGIAFGMFLLFSAGAQNNTGTIAGTVTDPDGGVVAGATIQAKNTSTGMLYKINTSRTGAFSIAALPTGTYELSIPTIGFTFLPYSRKDLRVERGQTVRADVRLEWSGNLGTIGDDTFLTIRNRYAGIKGRTPRTPDGKPDFSGIWNGSEDPNKEEFALLPWAAAIQKQRVENDFKDAPSGFCLPGEVLPSSPFIYKFIQTPSLFLQLAEDIPSVRQVFLDKRNHPKNLDPSWKGHSTGKWEGETLVVDTIGFNDKGWLPDAIPTTEKLHIVERYSRPDLAHLKIDVTIEDPATFTKPWHLHMTWELAPGEELIEYICAENNLFQPRGNK